MFQFEMSLSPLAKSEVMFQFEMKRSPKVRVMFLFDTKPLHMPKEKGKDLNLIPSYAPYPIKTKHI